MEEVSPVPTQEWEGEDALYTHVFGWHRHLLCTDSQTKTLAVAHSHRKQLWRHPLGPTANDLNYVDTRLDSQIGGTNRPQSPSHALSFPRWLLLSMLRVGILSVICRICAFPWYVGSHF